MRSLCRDASWRQPTRSCSPRCVIGPTGRRVAEGTNQMAVRVVKPTNGVHCLHDTSWRKQSECLRDASLDGRRDFFIVSRSPTVFLCCVFFYIWWLYWLAVQKIFWECFKRSLYACFVNNNVFFRQRSMVKKEGVQCKPATMHSRSFRISSEHCLFMATTFTFGCRLWCSIFSTRYGALAVYCLFRCTHLWPSANKRRLYLWCQQLEKTSRPFELLTDSAFNLITLKQMSKSALSRHMSECLLISPPASVA